MKRNSAAFPGAQRRQPAPRKGQALLQSRVICPAASLVAILVMIASPVLAQDASGNLVGTWTMTDFMGSIPA